MNISQLSRNASEIQKKTFDLKPTRRDGLILQLHHTVERGKTPHQIRFIHATFNSTGFILAVADHEGNIFILDFLQNKFWGLPSLKTCTVLSFSSYRSNDVVVGTDNGLLHIVDIEVGVETGNLIGHKTAVKEITYSSNHLCLTASNKEAIIFDLKNNVKIHALNVGIQSDLVHVIFMPASNNILACFHNNVMQIWKCETFEPFKRIIPSVKNYHIKTIAFTRNGRAMVLGGNCPFMTVFTLDTWAISKVINLPPHIPGVRRLEFIPQPFDGGANKILSFLTSSGVLYFFNMEEDIVINKIMNDTEIIKYSCCSDGKHVACILSSGEINVYNILQYLSAKAQVKPVLQKRTMITKKPKDTTETLTATRLQTILKEFGEYPEQYRSLIWSKLLKLPNNKSIYSAFINQGIHPSYENIEANYPVEDKLSLRNLKRLLSNVATWSPFFAQVEFLPVFVFPFVKVFQNDPVLCFEAVCSVLINWCQHWFEYYPMTPINTLAMIENILSEHDPQLLNHFTMSRITSKTYAWSLLEVAFSEVLTKKDWCVLWDHILSNEPSFILMAVVAYNILFRRTLMTFIDADDFETFYHRQNMLDIKTLIKKAYRLNANTSERNHPRQYLENFVEFGEDGYPVFKDYPKTLVDYEIKEFDDMKKEQAELAKVEREMEEQKIEEDRTEKLLQLQEEEESRLKDLEKHYQQKLLEEKDRIKQQRRHLSDLRKELHRREMKILNATKAQLIHRNIEERKSELDKIMNRFERNKEDDDMQMKLAEEELETHYHQLLKNKMEIENMIAAGQMAVNAVVPEHQDLLEQQQKLKEEIDGVRREAKSKQHLKHVKMAAGISALDEMIQKIEVELAKEMAQRQQYLIENQGNIKMLQLEAETKKLEIDVHKALNRLGKIKAEEGKAKMSELKNCIADRQQMLKEQKELKKKQEKMEKTDFIGPLDNSLQFLEQVCLEVQDGYRARPPSVRSDRKDISKSKKRLNSISVSKFGTT